MAMNITLKFAGKQTKLTLQEPKVRHIAKVASMVRGLDNPSEIDGVAFLLEVLSDGQVNREDFLESDASNLSVVSEALSPFLSNG